MPKLHTTFRLTAALAVCGLAGCVSTLARVELTPNGSVAAPPALAAFEGGARVTTPDDWRTQRAPVLREVFQRDVYGYFPDDFEVEAGEPQLIDAAAYDGLGRVELIPLTVRTRFDGGEWVETTIRLVVAKPNHVEGPAPVILKMDYCPYAQAFRIDDLPGGESEITLNGETRTVAITCGAKGFSPINSALWYSLGRYHISPPIPEMLERGYAYAAINSLDYVPDSGRLAPPRLQELSEGRDPETAWGALAAWAFQYSRAIDHLETDAALDPSRMAIYGHSRYGKAALVAGAFDERIDAVISHQSGRAGAALFQSEVGEPIEDLTSTYPTWLSRGFNARAEDGAPALSVDQHQLIALLAPRPVLLGHARRDSWSDPNSAFRAAQGADPVYELMGADGLTVDRLDDFDPAADIAFWIRGGTHGEVREDWPAFFDFLDAHFMAGD